MDFDTIMEKAYEEYFTFKTENGARRWLERNSGE
ncbi:DUF1391 family protein [Escherichia coli]|nr:DUF1391 family protein [Escherichia coli]